MKTKNTSFKLVFMKLSNKRKFLHHSSDVNRLMLKYLLKAGCYKRIKLRPFRFPNWAGRFI